MKILYPWRLWTISSTLKEDDGFHVTNSAANQLKCQMIPGVNPNQHFPSLSWVTFIKHLHSSCNSLLTRCDQSRSRFDLFCEGGPPSSLCLHPAVCSRTPTAFLIPRVTPEQNQPQSRREHWLGPRTRSSVTLKGIKTPVTHLMEWHGGAPKSFHPRVGAKRGFSRGRSRGVSGPRGASVAFYVWPLHKHGTERCHGDEEIGEQAALSFCALPMIGLSISQPDWKEPNQRAWLQSRLGTRVFWSFSNKGW